MGLKSKLILLAIPVVIGLVVLIAYQPKNNQAEGFQVSPHYPALREDGTFTEYAEFWVMNGAQQFYWLHGRWPVSWQEVVDDGLIDITLVNLSNEPIDPDNDCLSYYGDVRYLPPQGNQNPQVIRKAFTDGQETRLKEIKTPLSLSEQIAMVKQRMAQHGQVELAEELCDALKPEQVRKQYAVGSMLRHGVMLFSVLNGRYPDSLEELLASGVGPFTTQSINPFTGLPYKGDGNALDYSYYKIPKQVNKTAEFYLRCVDDQGCDSIVDLPNI